MSRRASHVLGAGFFLVALVAGGRQTLAAEWSADLFAEADTIELRTRAPGEEELWFPVWVVVVDGEVYVRLGGRATGRIEETETAPLTAVRVGDLEFDRVAFEPVPEQAERVAEEMADKYWSDVFVRFFSHPLTLRLSPAEE